MKTQEEKERSHKTNFRYSIDDFDVSLERIERELSVFYDKYNWPRPEAADVSTG